MIPGRVVVTELPSGITMRNAVGKRISPIDLLERAFNHAAVMCALAGEDPARSVSWWTSRITQRTGSR